MVVVVGLEKSQSNEPGAVVTDIAQRRFLLEELENVTQNYVHVDDWPCHGTPLGIIVDIPRLWRFPTSANGPTIRQRRFPLLA